MTIEQLAWRIGVSFVIILVAQIALAYAIVNDIKEEIEKRLPREGDNGPR
jgi:uncharacterized protein YebE (UPF0316 family)